MWPINSSTVHLSMGDFSGENFRMVVGCVRRQVELLSFQIITGSFGGADLGKDFFYFVLLFILELSNRADFIAKIYI